MVSGKYIARITLIASLTLIGSCYEHAIPSPWVKLTIDNSISGFYRPVFLTEKTGFVLGGYQHPAVVPVLLKTIDGGESWITIKLHPPTAGGFAGFYPVSDKIIYATGASNDVVNNPWTIYKSTDTGETWMPLEGNYYKTPGAIHFFDENNAFMFFNGPMKSSDGGRNWERLPNPDSIDFSALHAVVFPSKNVGYGLGGSYFDGVNFSIVFKTEDSGNTWKDITGKLSSNLSNATDWIFLDDNTGFVFTVDYQLYRTLDGGVNWELRNSGLPIIATGSVFFDHNEGYMCGGVGAGRVSHSGIYHTTDGGKTWKEEYSSNVSESEMLSFPSNKIGYVTSHDYIFKKVLK